MMMLNVILRKQWIEYEKLSYPMILLPFEMTKDASFYRNRLLWIGFAIGLGVDLLNGLNHLYPQIPDIPIRHSTFKRIEFVAIEKFARGLLPCAREQEPGTALCANPLLL